MKMVELLPLKVNDSSQLSSSFLSIKHVLLQIWKIKESNQAVHLHSLVNNLTITYKNSTSKDSHSFSTQCETSLFLIV